MGEDQLLLREEGNRISVPHVDLSRMDLSRMVLRADWKTGSYHRALRGV